MVTQIKKDKADHLVNDQHGFTMVELLLAAFILSIGILGLMSLQVSVIKSNATSRLRMTAVQVGQGVLESYAAEARQAWLFRTRAQGEVPPNLSPDFDKNVTKSFNYYGNPINPASSDPREAKALFTTTSSVAPVRTGASATEGRLLDFTVEVVYSYTPNVERPENKVAQKMTFSRRVMV